MFTLIFGIFAFLWTALFTAVGLTVLVPFLLIAVFFRIGLFFVKLVAGVFLLSLFAICLF